MTDLTDQDVRADLDAAANAPPPTAQPHPVAAAPMTPVQAAQLPPPPRASNPSFIDSMVAHADNFASQHGLWAQALERLQRASVAGVMKGAVSAADTAKSTAESSGAGLAAAEDPAHAEEALTAPDPFTPMYEHARSAVMDVRDAIALKDPSIPESLVEGAWQFAPSYLMLARVTGAIGGLANLWKNESFVGALKQGGSIMDALVSGVKGAAGSTARFAAADTPNSMIMQGPHDPRLADTVQLMRTAEGKLGDMLKSIAPDGGLLNHYIEFQHNRNETEAEGRWKNALDSYGAAAVITGLLHAGGTVLKQSWNGLHFMADNNMKSMGDIMPSGSPAAQRGAFGWHGTPSAPFEAFDDAKIGTGQGAQSFGYGHYIGENEATGESYQKSLAGRYNTSPTLMDAQAAVKSNAGDKVKTVKQLTEQLSNPEVDAGMRGKIERMIDLIKKGKVDAGAGSLLKVEVDDKHIANMLDLDKPMSEQPKVLKQIGDEDRAKLEQMLEDHDQHPDLENYSGNEFRQIVERAHAEGYLTAGDLADANIPRVASNYLDSKGIPGSKYFDQLSRGPQLLGTDGHLLPVKGSAEEGARNLAIGWGGVDKAIQYAKRLGWDKPKAFDQDQEKFAALLDFKQRGADVGPGGTRNFVVFKGKNIKIVEKNGKPVEK